jgi:ornithine cyclodeaminase
MMNIRILSKQDVQNSIDMPAAIDATREAFLQLADGEVNMPLRTPVKIGEDSLSLFMPGYLADAGQLGIKVVSVFPGNAERQLPSINGVVLLIDEQTGQPKALLEAGYLTALRTGAVSGLATDLLASKQAKVLAIIGAGAQAEFQVEAVCAVRDIQQIQVYSRNFARTEAFAKKLAEKYQGRITVIASQSIAEACQNADIINTATSSTEAFLFSQYLKAGAHINAIGSHNEKMHEVSGEVLAQSLVVVDQTQAALSEAGEIISAVKQGLIKSQDLLELGMIARNTAARLPKAKFTVFKSVGLAIQDVSVAHKALQLAIEKNYGISIAL